MPVQAIASNPTSASSAGAAAIAASPAGDSYSPTFASLLDGSQSSGQPAAGATSSHAANAATEAAQSANGDGHVDGTASSNGKGSASVTTSGTRGARNHRPPAQAGTPPAQATAQPAIAALVIPVPVPRPAPVTPAAASATNHSETSQGLPSAALDASGATIGPAALLAGSTAAAHTELILPATASATTNRNPEATTPIAGPSKNLPTAAGDGSLPSPADVAATAATPAPLATPDRNAGAPTPLHAAQPTAATPAAAAASAGAATPRPLPVPLRPPQPAGAVADTSRNSESKAAPGDANASPSASATVTPGSSLAAGTAAKPDGGDAGRHHDGDKNSNHGAAPSATAQAANAAAALTPGSSTPSPAGTAGGGHASPSGPAAAPAGHQAGLASWQSTSTAAALSAAHGNEMNVALHSGDLGNLQLHAALHNNSVGATITVDRPDVHNWLAAQLPALEQTLNTRQMQVGSVQLQQQSSGNATDPGAGNRGGSQTSAQPQSRHPARGGSDSRPRPVAGPNWTPGTNAYADGRLNLRA